MHHAWLLGRSRNLPKRRKVTPASPQSGSKSVKGGIVCTVGQNLSKEGLNLESIFRFCQAHPLYVLRSAIHELKDGLPQDVITNYYIFKSVFELNYN
jgi:hypothetical protein